MTDELSLLRAMAEQVGRYLEAEREVAELSVFRDPVRHGQSRAERDGFKTMMAMHCELWRRKYANPGPRAA